ncbi:hypothetical protein Tco_0695796, partial [Tanacetum coccineum]
MVGLVIGKVKRVQPGKHHTKAQAAMPFTSEKMTNSLLRYIRSESPLLMLKIIRLRKIDKRCGDDVMYKLNKQGCLEFDLKRVKSDLLVYHMEFEEDAASVDLDGVLELTGH